MTVLEHIKQLSEELSPEEKRNLWKGVLPSEVFRRNCYVSFWFEKWGPAHTIDMIGEDNVMFETDFPHPTCLYPQVREQVQASLGGLDRSLQRWEAEVLRTCRRDGGRFRRTTSSPGRTKRASRRTR